MFILLMVGQYCIHLLVCSSQDSLVGFVVISHVKIVSIYRIIQDKDRIIQDKELIYVIYI